MGFNIYKEIPKIKQTLLDQGYKANIPKPIFCKSLMLMYGMKRRTSIEWVKNFKSLNLITINDNDNIDFVNKEK